MRGAADRHPALQLDRESDEDKHLERKRRWSRVCVTDRLSGGKLQKERGCSLLRPFGLLTYRFVPLF